MTIPLARPAHKNPLLRTPRMNLPPAARGRIALGITAAAAEGRFELQVCADCGTVQYSSNPGVMVTIRSSVPSVQ